jgi:hypothetical protein
MDVADPGATSTLVQALLLALDDCERFHPVEAALQTRAYLGAIRGHLARLLRVADVRPEQLATLAAISDFAYGWGIVEAYTPRIQAQVGNGVVDSARGVGWAGKWMGMST